MTVVYFMILLALRRVIILIMTAKTSFPATYIFGTLSHFLPAYHFSRHAFFRADGAPEEIALKRERAFDAMQVPYLSLVVSN